MNRNRKMKWQNKIAQFLRGRYGFMDQFNKFILSLSIILMIFSFFIFKNIFQVISIALIIYGYFRIFSKKIYQRSDENQKFLAIIKPVRAKLSLWRKKVTTFKEYKYVTCSECKQDIRLPKKKGKIMVTCPKCQHKFQEKT